LLAGYTPCGKPDKTMEDPMIGIYGANGFIGRHLVMRMAERGFDVRAVSRKFGAEFIDRIGNKAEFVQADIQQSLEIASSLQDMETVIQLVSSSSPGMKNDYIENDILDNVIPQVNFLRNCVLAGVKRYIFLSSGGAVYGPGSSLPVNESSPTNPISSYGLTKLMVEKYIQMHGHVDGLQYVILRVANPFGSGQEFKKGQGLIPAILDHWRRDQPIRIFGDGAAMRDYIYIDDLVDAVEAAVALPGSTKILANVGSGTVRSVLEVVDTIEEVMGVKLKREYVGVRSTDVDIASLDISFARQVLQWAPKTEFRRGIEMTLQRA